MSLWNSLKWMTGVTLLLLQHSFAQPDLSVFNRFHKGQATKSYQAKQTGNHSSRECNSISCYRYYRSETAPFLIEQWPDVEFDTGEFYSGSIPIDESDPTRTMFFIFKPATEKPVDEVTIWLNGGPGCSSLFGFFDENGPISWEPGTGTTPSGLPRTRKNEFAWSTITNMLWVEYPIGVGYNQGRVTARNEVGPAEEFVSFSKNWQKIFGISNYKIYVTGESYAGRYVPYIAAQMLDQKDETYFNLSGALVYDPCIGDCGGSVPQYPTYSFVKANNLILNINQTYLQKLERISSDCGFTEYMDKYLQFPPSGNQPTEENQPSASLHSPKGDCDIGLTWAFAQLSINPCYNDYHITDTCPLLLNQYWRYYYLYFNRRDVKEAIHAPLNVTWHECSARVFVQYEDLSPDPIQGVLPQVIESTNRVLVANADWDSIIFTNFTLLSIQNMTWNGKLGFQEAPSRDFVVPIPEKAVTYPYPASLLGTQGTMGKQHYERGLQWVETYQSGHEQPQYQPRAALRHLQWLLGRIETL